MIDTLLPGAIGDAGLKAAALVPLACILLAAVRQDVRDNRIPNLLILVGMLLGLAVHTLLPAGYGFLSVVPGGMGPLAFVQGLAIGGGLLLPLYVLGALGAGDVKLMAVVGGFLGPDDVLAAVVATFIAGGLVSLAVALRLGRLGLLFRNVAAMLYLTVLKLPLPGLPAIEPPAQPAGKAPYSIAVALGTLAAGAWIAAGLHLI